MDKVFLSQNNYGILHDIIKTTIFNRLNYDIDNDRKANFLNKLMIIMKQIYEDRNKFNISEDLSMIEKIKQLNKYTLDLKLFASLSACTSSGKEGSSKSTGAKIFLYIKSPLH